LETVERRDYWLKHSIISTIFHAVEYRLPGGEAQRGAQTD
jgi:hypothetical protein